MSTTPEGRQIIFSMVNVSKIHPPQKQGLKDIYISFYYGAKIGVLGLNGSGKSTLLRIMAGVDKNYIGEIHQSPGYSIGMLEQEAKLDQSKTVMDIVREGVKQYSDILNEFEELTNKFGDDEVMNDPDKMNRLI